MQQQYGMQRKRLGLLLVLLSSSAKFAIAEASLFRADATDCSSVNDRGVQTCRFSVEQLALEATPPPASIQLTIAPGGRVISCTRSASRLSANEWYDCVCVYVCLCVLKYLSHTLGRVCVYTK
jgi:hypothetical protein